MPMAAATRARLEALVESPCCFDVADPTEVANRLDLGIGVGRLIWTDPAGVGYARGRGIGLFAVDDRAGIDRIAAEAPGARVIVRRRRSAPDLPLALTVRAALRGLDVAGVGIGWRTDTDGSHAAPQWASALRLHRDVRRIGIEMTLLDVPLGEGEPGCSLDRIRASYAACVGGPRPALLMTVPRVAGAT